MGLERNQEINLDDVRTIVAEAEQWMTGREYAVVSQRVLQLTKESGCSAYDCEFVSLAMDLGIPLVTADRQVLRAFPNVAMTAELFVKQ
jgi:predicted nucleic acid-binding protein